MASIEIQDPRDPKRTFTVHADRHAVAVLAAKLAEAGLRARPPVKRETPANVEPVAAPQL